MYHLTLFGGLNIEGEDGSPPGRSSQRRRLALLALLASPPGRRVARDKLTAFLWPETTDERARRNLSSALYDFRTELGDDVLLVSGDALALNPAVITTDVSRFVDALEAGDTQGAAAAYAGPFLDGFYIDHAEEFERWAEAERQRYCRDYRQALLQLAERQTADANWLGAAEAWHRLSVIDPYSARIAVGYMNALEAAGDRAGALQFARVHAALLREELGATPSPEVMAVADRLRDTPTPATIAATRATTPKPSEAEPETATPELDEDVAPAAERTPGPRASPTAGRSAADRGQRSRWALRGTAAAAALAIVAATLLARAAVDNAALPGGPEQSIGIAVMPFQNLGGSLDVDFGAGLTEEIISGLGKVGSLRIPSRTTMVLYQDRAVPPRVVGEELGVRYLVEGTVRSEANRLRITASLADTRTGSQVWGEQYDLRMASVFDAQEEIAQAVVRAVAPQVADTVGPLVQSTTRDPQAYRLYIRGRGHWYRRGTADLSSALASFTQALELDREYALAYSAMADVYNLLGAYDYGLAPPTEMYPAARQAAERALSLNPELAEAHAALANVQFNYDWDLGAAEQRYRRAIRLNPGYGMTRHWLSLLLAASGRHDEAMAEIHTALEVDPGSPVLSASLARHHYFLGAYDQAIEEFHHTIDLDPYHVLAYLGAGLAWIQLKQYDRALAEYQHAADIIGIPHPPTLALMGHAEGLAGRRDRATAIQRQLVELRAAGKYVAPHYLALVAIGLGDIGTALDRLEESTAERSAAILYARIDPVVDPVRSEPRFRALLGAASP